MSFTHSYFGDLDDRVNHTFINSIDKVFLSNKRQCLLYLKLLKGIISSITEINSNSFSIHFRKNKPFKNTSFKNNNYEAVSPYNFFIIFHSLDIFHKSHLNYSCSLNHLKSIVDKLYCLNYLFSLNLSCYIKKPSMFLEKENCSVLKNNNLNQMSEEEFINVLYQNYIHVGDIELTEFNGDISKWDFNHIYSMIATFKNSFFNNHSLSIISNNLINLDECFYNSHYDKPLNIIAHNLLSFNCLFNYFPLSKMEFSFGFNQQTSKNKKLKNLLSFANIDSEDEEQKNSFYLLQPKQFNACLKPILSQQFIYDRKQKLLNIEQNEVSKIQGIDLKISPDLIGDNFLLMQNIPYDKISIKNENNEKVSYLELLQFFSLISKNNIDFDYFRETVFFIFSNNLSLSIQQQTFLLNLIKEACVNYLTDNDLNAIFNEGFMDYFLKILFYKLDSTHSENENNRILFKEFVLLLISKNITSFKSKKIFGFMKHHFLHDHHFFNTYSNFYYNNSSKIDNEICL